MELGEDNNRSFDLKIIFFALGAGGLSAILAMSLVTGSGLALILAYLAPFPLFAVGLGHGGKAAAIATFSGIAFATLLSGPIAGCAYAIMNALPVWLTVRLALTSREGQSGEEWFPAGNILTTFVFYGCGVFALLLMFFSPGDQSIVQMVDGFLTTTINALAPTLDSSSRAEMVASLGQLFPAMILVSWMVMNLVNGMLAQFVLSKSDKALRPSPRYGDLKLPDLSSWAFIICATLTVIGSGDMKYIAMNLTAVTAFPFFVVGLCVVHSFARMTRFAGGLLGVFYLMLLLSIWTALPIIGLGLFDQWIGLRKRIAAQADIQEND